MAEQAAVAEKANSVPVSVLWAGAAAVVLASIITAATVILQTRTTLAAEQRRLETQLKHEREMREREELRKLVDEAAARLDLLTFEVDDLRRARLRIEAEMGSSSLKLGQSDEFDECLEKVFDGLREVDTLAARLAVRLSQEHEMVEIYREAWKCYFTFRATMAKGSDPDPDTFKNAGLYSGQFMRAGHELLGSQLG